MKKYKINICLDIWATGGAEIGYKRIASKLPQYTWIFTSSVDPQADLVIYSNNHKYYEQAKKLDIPTIQRMTGPRSYNLPQPEDLKIVICSSKRGYELSKHPNKVLIYNGIDLDYIKTIKPIECDLLYSPARLGIGQKVEDAIKYAQQHKRHLTVLGAKQHLHEDTYDQLRVKYPQTHWTGLVDVDTASAYMRGCKAYICPTSIHGVSNAVIEAICCDKPIINLGGVEIPNKVDIDLNITAEKYNKLIQEILNGL